MYIYGAARSHLEDYAAEFYAARGIVYIVPQYRMSIYGLVDNRKHYFSPQFSLFKAWQPMERARLPVITRCTT